MMTILRAASHQGRFSASEKPPWTVDGLLPCIVAPPESRAATAYKRRMAREALNRGLRPVYGWPHSFS